MIDFIDDWQNERIWGNMKKWQLLMHAFRFNDLG